MSAQDVNLVIQQRRNAPSQQAEKNPTHKPLKVLNPQVD
jgi:hypothetical protein